nr:reverse transcriptase domain-containing protein [Tanacetum cinerariifolium]
MVKDRIMDFGALFHATYCKEELERQLDEEGYHVGFRDQQWKVTKGGLVVACRNKCGSLIGMSMLASKCNVPDVRKVDIYFCKPGGLGKQKNISFIMLVKTRKLQRGGMARVSLAYLKVFGCDLFVKVKDVRGEAMKCTFICSGSDEIRYSFWDTKTHQKSQVVLIDILKNLAENDIRVSEHELSSKITQSLGGRLRDSKGTKIHHRVQGSGKKKAIIEEMVSLEKNQACSLVRLPVGKKASQSLWMFKVKEEQDDSKSTKARVFSYLRKRKPKEQIKGNSLWNDSSTEATVGDEREVEVLRSFNWPSSLLKTDDGVLPERAIGGYTQETAYAIREPPPAGPPPQNNNGPPPMVRPNGQDPHSMEELCQPSINGWGGPIALILIQATNFGLRHHMIQQVQNTCQFHGLSVDDANRHIDKFLEITQHMKQNGVSDDA